MMSDVQLPIFLMLFMGPGGQKIFSKIMILAQIHPYKYSWTSILYTSL